MGHRILTSMPQPGSLKGRGPSSRISRRRDTKTYGSQSTFVLKVVGTQKTTVIFCGDQWRPRALWDSRYLWMPLEIGDGKAMAASTPALVD